jgi:hypothetical protein
MFLIAYYRMDPAAAVASIGESVESRNRCGATPQLVPFSNACLLPIINSMIHGNDFGIVHDAGVNASSELLVDVPHPAIPLATRRPPTHADAAFLDYMMTERNYRTYMIQPRPEEPAAEAAAPALASAAGESIDGSAAHSLRTASEKAAAERADRAARGYSQQSSAFLGPCKCCEHRRSCAALHRGAVALHLQCLTSRGRVVDAVPWFGSSATYPALPIVEWWYPPTWDAAKPPGGREKRDVAEFIDLTSPITWFVKQGSTDEQGLLRVMIGPKLDWDMCIFPHFKDGQTVTVARAFALEWISTQPDADSFRRVPVRSCLRRMIGRSNALLDPACVLSRTRDALNTAFGLLGYELDTTALRTPMVEIMRPIVEDLRLIRDRLLLRGAKRRGAM